MQNYKIGFTIFSGKSMQSEDGGLFDPYCKVECWHEVFTTEIKTEMNPSFVPFQDSNLWSKIQLYPEEFESAYVEFSVYSRNFFSKNYLVGKASLQLASINTRSYHVYAKKWLTLKRPESTDVCGMLEITVFCLKPGETPPPKSIQDGGGEEAGGEGEEDMEDLSKAVLKNTTEAPTGRPHHIILNIHKVDDLPAPSNPFVTVEFADEIVRTPAGSNVVKHTFNYAIRIPVMTPVFEDTILVKLWNSYTWGADELLAQGLISFSELRNNALSPQWFCLYGWDADEIADIQSVTKTGESISPNTYKGKMLISGNIEKLEDVEDLSAAGFAGKPTVSQEPAMEQKALLADVYDVCGAVGRECMVQLAFGNVKDATQYMVPKSYFPKHFDEGKSDPKGSSSQSASKIDTEPQDEEAVTTFSYSQSDGRIPPLLIMAPEDASSQPKVMVNIFTRGVLSGQQRIGFNMSKLGDWPKYDQGNPRKPSFLAMEPMPYNTDQKTPASVLMVIETHPTDDVNRHNRKPVKPLPYIIRAYIFMARNIKDSHIDDTAFALRISSAGVSMHTEALSEQRPMWMQVLDLRVTLCSDHPQQPPTMEPITATLCRKSAGGFTDIGKSVCSYQYMRKKDNIGKWEPYKLEPQWVRINGGQYGTKNAGEILIGFELLQWRYREELELAPKKMWPVPFAEFKELEHYCALKKATLHFSLYGLRDLTPQGAIGSEISDPKVIVRVKKFEKESRDLRDASSKGKAAFEMDFKYVEIAEGEDPLNKENKMQTWATDAMGKSNCSNFEFFQTGSMNIEIPDKMALEPGLSVRVVQKPMDFSFVPEVVRGWIQFDEGNLVGEHRQSLNRHFPCNWLPNIKVDGKYEHTPGTADGQVDDIVKLLDKGVKDAMCKDCFTEMSTEQRARELKKIKDQKRAEGAKHAKNLIVKQEEEEEQVNSKGLPWQLRPYTVRGNPKGYPLEKREVIELKPTYKQNMHERTSFKPQKGEKVMKAVGGGRKRVHEKLEFENSEMTFQQDFWYKCQPLLRDTDMIDPYVDGHWRQQNDMTYGFVKFAFKLTDGWTDPPPSSLEGEEADPASAAEETPMEDPDDIEDKTKLTQSNYFNLEDNLMLGCFAFKKKFFQMRYKAKANVPSRVKVRLYFMRAICIFDSASFGDPYLKFSVGDDSQSMRQERQENTNMPDFYITEERDVTLPSDNTLVVEVWDAGMNDSLDSLIGKTAVDLEDRWHSDNWKKTQEKGTVPIENRPLVRLNDGIVAPCGSIEMWVEMVDSVRASDIKPSVLNPPPDQEIDIRVVLWTCDDIPPQSGDTINIKLNCNLDCKTFLGKNSYYPEHQITDVHNGSTGHGIFNWRAVFPKITPKGCKSCVMRIGVSEAGAFNDTPVGDVQLDMLKYIEKVAKSSDAINVPETELHFVPINKDPDAEEGVEETCGSVKVSMTILTNMEGTCLLCGNGRDEPNMYPVLITPVEGRGWGDFFAGFSFSLPDFGLMKKLAPLMVVTLFCVIILKQLGLL